jgi:RimJ/RimL family protein N-acetyltransferase
MNIQATLQDGELLLRPLVREDFDALRSIASDPLLWEQHPAKERATLEGFKQWFSQAETAMTLECNGEIVGTTRFRPLIDHPTAIEIGWTFIKRKCWGTGLNTRAKHLMLRCAFTYYEHVLFFIDVNNIRSQRAVEKLGADRIRSLNGKKIEDRPTAGAVFCIHRDDFTGS